MGKHAAPKVIEFEARDYALPPNADDRAFFKRHRLRHYRLRLATKEELALLAEAGDRLEPENEDDFLFVAVQRLTMNKRLRAFFYASAIIAPHLKSKDEAMARMVFERVSSVKGISTRELSNILDQYGMCEFKMDK